MKRKDNPRFAPSALMFACEKLGSRWTLMVLRELLDGPLRFSQLQERVPWVSGKSLTRVLAKLEHNGLIKRNVHRTRPPNVSYSLSMNDPMLREIIDAVLRWGTKKYLQQEARRRPPA